MIEFKYPLILIVFIPFFVLLIVDFFITKKSISFQNITEKLPQTLFNRVDFRKVKLKKVFTLSSVALLILAASGPQIGVRLSPIERKGLDLVFCIDVSSSMRGTDIKPSRLDKSKFEVSQMIKNLKGDRVAFIVFAGSSHLYLPLTTDYEAAYLFLDQIDTQMIPTQGTDLSTAIQTGLSAFSDDDLKYKVLVLITDGEDHEGKAIDLAKKASREGMVVHTVGVGTLSGSLIPTISSNGSTNYKKNKDGKLITSQLNETVLKDIAKAGGGVFTSFNNKPANYKKLLNEVDSMEKRSIASHVYSEFEDQYQKFGLLSLSLLVIGMLLSTKKKNHE